MIFNILINTLIFCCITLLVITIFKRVENKTFDNVSPPENKKYSKDDKNRYRQWLKDDKWKQKRLEILKQKNFTCEQCGKHRGILNVHHKYYYRYKDGEQFKPWDYPDYVYQVLCKECHEHVHSKQNIKCYTKNYYSHKHT